MEIAWNFHLVRPIFEARFQRYVGLWLLAFWDRVWCAIFWRTPRLRFFHFDSIFDFAHQRYYSTGNQFERFRGFLELISRFEFEFRRREIFFF